MGGKGRREVRTESRVLQDEVVNAKIKNFQEKIRVCNKTRKETRGILGME
jgi:hypothetical protein